MLSCSDHSQSEKNTSLVEKNVCVCMCNAFQFITYINIREIGLHVCMWCYKLLRIISFVVTSFMLFPVNWSVVQLMNKFLVLLIFVTQLHVKFSKILADYVHIYVCYLSCCSKIGQQWVGAMCWNTHCTYNTFNACSIKKKTRSLSPILFALSKWLV